MSSTDGRRLIQRSSTSDQVAEILRNEILTGELTPGTPLREVALANSLGVSRNTIREGIRILVSEGILHHNVHRGVSVARLSPADVSDIYATRRVLEVAAIRGSRPSGGQLEELRRLVHALEAAARSRDPRQLVELDLAFHLALVRLLGLERLTSFADRVLAELRLGLFLVDTSDRDEPSAWAGVHSEVCELLEQGKRAESGRLLERHLDEAERNLLAVVGDGP
jgi:DNA-binding GntR family transcriptional regulator